MENFVIFGGNYFTDFLPPRMCWIVWDKREGMASNTFADCELAWTSFDKATRLYKQLWSGLVRKGDRKKEGKNRSHPTQKPVGLMEFCIKSFTKETNNIYDGFGGSGSTLIACEQLNRKCFMMELDEHYCSVIIERFEKLTNKKGVKL